MDKTMLDQLITIVPDGESGDATKDGEKVSLDGAPLTAAKVIGGAGALMLPLGWLLGSAMAAKAIYEAINKARSSGLAVTPVSLSLTNQLSFPPGHPMMKVVYCRHPAKANTYYPVASFHRHVFEHKFSEAVKLLAYLGAREINVQHVKGWSRDFAAQISSPLPSTQAPGQAGVEAGASSKSLDTLLFNATLNGSDTPRLIDHPTWLPHEATWEMIADLRMSAGLKEFSLSVNYEEDYQINAALNAKVKDLGFEVGGKFEDHVSTIWVMNGKFGTDPVAT